VSETSKAIHELTKLIGHYHIQEVKLSTKCCDYYLTHLLAIVAERDALAAEVATLKAQADPIPAQTYGVDPANGRDYTVIADIGADGRVESVRIDVPEEDAKEAKP
jgi:chorismate mutase